MLFGAVGFVLLIACANIANLLLARALGAPARACGPPRARRRRGRLVRLLLTESVLLAVLGGIAGAAVTVWLLEALFALVPAGLPRLAEDRDRTARCSRSPRRCRWPPQCCSARCRRLQFSRTDVNDALKEGGAAPRRRPSARCGRRSSSSNSRWRWCSSSAPRCSCSSFWRLQHVELGFKPDGRADRAAVAAAAQRSQATAVLHAPAARWLSSKRCSGARATLPGVTAAARGAGAAVRRQPQHGRP